MFLVVAWFYCYILFFIYFITEEHLNKIFSNQSYARGAMHVEKECS